jgi:hypothetical protein
VIGVTIPSRRRALRPRWGKAHTDCITCCCAGVSFRDCMTRVRRCVWTATTLPYSTLQGDRRWLYGTCIVGRQKPGRTLHRSQFISRFDWTGRAVGRISSATTSLSSFLPFRLPLRTDSVAGNDSSLGSVTVPFWFVTQNVRRGAPTDTVSSIQWAPDQRTTFGRRQHTPVSLKRRVTRGAATCLVPRRAARSHEIWMGRPRLLCLS